VQVHHDEGVANRIDPESCANTREGIGEALTGERIGQPLSRESTLILWAITPGYLSDDNQVLLPVSGPSISTQQPTRKLGRSG
jgi:hypothetical protein